MAMTVNSHHDGPSFAKSALLIICRADFADMILKCAMPGMPRSTCEDSRTRRRKRVIH